MWIMNPDSLEMRMRFSRTIDIDVYGVTNDGGALSGILTSNEAGRGYY